MSRCLGGAWTRSRGPNHLPYSRGVVRERISINLVIVVMLRDLKSSSFSSLNTSFVSTTNIVVFTFVLLSYSFIPFNY